jgi:hypothetical protein
MGWRNLRWKNTIGPRKLNGESSFYISPPRNPIWCLSIGVWKKICLTGLIPTIGLFVVLLLRMILVPSSLSKPVEPHSLQKSCAYLRGSAGSTNRQSHSYRTHVGLVLICVDAVSLTEHRRADLIKIARSGGLTGTISHGIQVCKSTTAIQLP